jgi:hypothetical protein
MSDIDLAVSRSRKLEQVLEREFGASGRGLHEKTSSVERDLPHELVRKLRLVATVRNKVVHEADRIDDKRRFTEAAASAERELKALARSRRGKGAGGSFRWVAALIALLMLAAAAAAWLLRG